MKTAMSSKIYACIETSYTESNGDDAEVFIGSLYECNAWMKSRYESFKSDEEFHPDRDQAWIEKKCGLGHAVVQSGCGEYRYEWYVVIPKERSDSDKVWTVVFSYGEEKERKFDDEDSLVRWLKEGMYSCEGAERDHYVNMLAEYDSGKTVLHY